MPPFKIGNFQREMQMQKNVNFRRVINGLTGISRDWKTSRISHKSAQIYAVSRPVGVSCDVSQPT